MPRLRAARIAPAVAGRGASQDPVLERLPGAGMTGVRVAPSPAPPQNGA